MTDAPAPVPAIVEPAPNAIVAQVLEAYASYFYGESDVIRHSPTRLRQFANVAWEHRLMTIADYFERLVEREELRIEAEEFEAIESQERDERDLRFIYS